MKYSEEEKTIIFAKHFIKDNEGVFAMGKKETQTLLNLITKQQKEIENSVSKDKIREYKQKFEKDSKTEKVFMTQSSQINASLISFCDELLERK